MAEPVTHQTTISMRALSTSIALLACATLSVDAAAQDLPRVYDVENTGVDCPAPPLPPYRDLPTIESLPDPFEWSAASRGRIARVEDWRCRRAEVGTELQHYELGTKPPPPDDIDVTFEDGRLTIVIEDDEGDAVVMTVPVNVPEGEGPFPAVIGVGFGATGSLPAAIFTSRNVATLQYDVNDVAVYGTGTGRYGPFYTIFPNRGNDVAGKFGAWAWGVSRIIDALERVPELDVDTAHLAVTGCSFAGKIALFSGALDERIALTIAQEPGGGGAASWRVTETLDGSRETLGRTDGAWYRPTFISQFGRAVETLPYDHHELMAMVAPRALLVLGNPDYEWLAEESGHVASMAAQEVWAALGVPDRFGVSIVDGHGHCQLPNSQRPEVEAFVDKFLLGDESADTDVAVSPYTTDLTPWITWDTPDLTLGTNAADDPSAPGDGAGLLKSYPNPFGPTTTIDYVVREPAHVELAVYDVLGQRVRTLVDGVETAGTYSVEWRGDDDSGSALPTGVYVGRIRIGEAEAVRTMVRVR